MTLLERYINGQTKQVYEDIYALGADAFLPARLSEVGQVLSETFQRTAYNLTVVYNALKQVNYLFKENPKYNFERAIHKPLPDTDMLLTQLEQAASPFGFIPLSLKYFYRIVGGVNFVWDYEANENILWEQADPIQIASLDAVTETVTDKWWREDMQQYTDDKNFGYAFLELSADELHKDNVSGGPAYAVQLTKEASIDSLFLNEPNNTTFIDYLRICFEYCGFPGMAGEETCDSFKTFSDKIKPQLKSI